MLNYILERSVKITKLEKMATPQEHSPIPQPDEEESQLSLISGGQTAETARRFGIEVPSLVILLSRLNESQWEGMSREELIEEREKVSDFMRRLSEVETEAYLARSAALEKMRWLNGMITVKPAELE